MSDALLYEAENGIGRIVFDRPLVRNAFTFAMYASLPGILARVDADPSIEALILTGRGDTAFTSGTDIGDLRQLVTAADVLAYEALIESSLDALESCRLPVIAAIAGACTGAGAILASCCDLRIGTSATTLAIPIARTLGNCLSLANFSRLAALIGPARVKELIFSARTIDAQEALGIGFLTEVVADPSRLQIRATETAQFLTGLAPLTLRATKRACLRHRGQWAGASDDLVLSCYLSADFREGVASFLEKRMPAWRGI